MLGHVHREDKTRADVGLGAPLVAFFCADRPSATRLVPGPTVTGGAGSVVGRVPVGDRDPGPDGRA